MRKEFYKNLFLPTSIVLLYWLFNLPSFFLKLSFFESNLYEWIGLSVLILVVILIVIKLVKLIYKKEYVLVGAIVLGIPVAVMLGFASIILLLGFSGVGT